MVKKDGNMPKKGMNRDVHPSELSQEEYSFALNANFQDEHGNGTIILQNEPSNIKCTGFKEGFKVIGHKFDINADRTYFFLVNPTTGCSEIGYIDSTTNVSGLEQVESQCNCNISVVLEDALENTIQESVCSYYTIINDCEEGCSMCLNFNINYPIHEVNIQIKDEVSGKVIYWTDNHNPQRYLKIDRIQDYLETVDDCTGVVTPTCLQCDKMRIFPLFNKPCLFPRQISNGGNLRAGMYEAIVAYSSFEGDAISNYYSITNPIPIFDRNNNILDQTLLDYQTNQAIALELSDLDSSYEYYTIAIIYRSGLDGAARYYKYGTYPIDTIKVTVATLMDKKSTTLEDLLARRPHYTKAKGLSESNGHLFQYGLTAHREFNLQPIINLVGSFIKWNTLLAAEDIYENSIFVSKYTGFMRDEVYPLSIKFFAEGGYESPNFTFIARPPKASEIEELDAPGSTFVTNTSTTSVLASAPLCSGTERNKRWQFENTATVDEDTCLIETAGYVENTEIREVESTCDVGIVDTLASDTVEVNTTLDIVTYINQNIDAIIASTDPQWATIQTYLDPLNYPLATCVPLFEDNCSETITLVDEEMYAIATATETVTEVPADFADYPRVVPPTSCLNTLTDETGTPVVDTTFSSTYMRPGDIVYKKIMTPANMTCSGAQLIPAYLGSPTMSQFMLNKGALSSFSSLQTTLPVTLTAAGFTGFLHTNALWFKLDFGTRTEAIVELSTIFCNLADDNSGSQLRVSFYDSCSAVSDVAAYGTIISDVTLANDPNKFVQLDVADFSSGVAYIAVDSPIRSESEWQVTLSGASGDMTITIDSIPYALTYDGVGLTTTAALFVTNHSAALNALDIDVTSSSNIITFRSLQSSFTGAVVANVNPNLNGVKSEIESYHTLTPPCGCFGIYDRSVVTSKEFTFTNMTFGKRQTYMSECTFVVPTLNGCDPLPYQHGDFSYWESILKYPCNAELYDSSNIKIKPADLATLPLAEQTAFEDYYVSGGSAAPVLDIDGNYVLVGADFRDQPIRHYKFPDSTKVPFMSVSTQNPGAYKPSVIYPIGFKIDNDVINTFLDIAVNNGYLSIEERNSIKKYEIFRGDRRTDKSIIAKGLLYDVYQYQDNITNEYVNYSNYPLNSLGKDRFNDVNHPYLSAGNNKFTFHSPDTHFYKPTLPRELGVEGYQFGRSEVYFDEVKDHSTYTILGQQAYDVATTLAVAEIVLETLLQVSDWMVTAGTGGYSTAIAIALAVLAVVALVITNIFKTGEYRYKWLQTFTNLGRPVNFAYYQAAIGHYNYFKPNLSVANYLRGIPSTTYLKSGRWTIPNEVTGDVINFNNTDREDSVFIGLGSSSNNIIYTADYIAHDNQSTGTSLSSRRTYKGTGKSAKLLGNAASLYASLKQYVPEQYGTINNIDWVNTGYCGDLNSNLDCDPIFGGDTYISRFAVKRKLPFFTSTAHGLAPNVPFAYSEYFNINPVDPATNTDDILRYFINYKMNVDEQTFMGIVFPDDRSHYYLDNGGNDIGGFYVKPPNKFYLYSYGVPYFLVESTYNCNFRYAKREAHENFYPNVRDVIDWTQESNVPIKEPNTYFYNDVYSLAHTKSPWRLLPTNYEEDLYEDLNNLENTVIYSRQDISESDLTDPWLMYRASDMYQFPTSYGKLIQMGGVESEQVLARFTNGFAIFGSIDVLAERIAPENRVTGTGSMFAGRSVAFNKTELGYAGTQHTTKVSTEFGHIWADAKRGKVFNLLPNAKGLEDLTVGLEKWFKENLPFKITSYYPTIDVDNNYKGIGLSMGWDDRLKRVFLTKLDYVPISEFICFNGTQFFSTDGYEDIIAEQVGLGLTYLGIENCKLKFRNDESINSFIDLDEIFVTNSDYFKDCSWTIAYSPLTESWVSYYSFKPNYYVNYHNYFQTGLNFPDDMMEFGLWSHYSFISSYQVFYGKLYPFTVEYPLTTKMSNSLLHNIEYWLDVRKYYNKYDFSDIYGIGFNKAVVYNNHQNSGYINLITQEKNNLQQMMQYPKHNDDNIEVLQTELHGKWSFNYLYNLIRDEKSGLPIWIADCPQIEKTIDNRLLDYRSNFKDRLRGDYFLTRLTQDLESRYKMLFRFTTDTRDYYEQ